MESTKLSCKDRIPMNMQSRESLLRDIYNACDDGSEYEGVDAIDALYDLALGISKYSIVRIELSWGGPADWLEAYVDTSGTHPEMFKLEYHISDWFDHAQVVVDEDNILYRYAEEIVSLTFNS